MDASAVKAQTPTLQSAAEENPTSTPEKTPDKTIDKRRALGRGLEALLPSSVRTGWASHAVEITQGRAADAATLGTPVGDIQAQAERAKGTEGAVEIPLDRIDPNPYQTRVLKRDDPEAMQELADSIRVNGVVQPVVVRPGSEGRYLLITGDRRCRASRLAGRTTVPAVIRRVSDQQAAEMTIVENLQREDLNCMEQAAAFVRLSQKFGLTQEQIGDRVGMARETVSNYMRLLKLPGSVMQYLQDGTLKFSEARVLLQFNDSQVIARLADEAVRKHMSVEQVERLCAQEYVLKEAAPPKLGRARWVDPNVRAAQRQLEQILGVRVKIRDQRGKGKIVIEYSTLEDFDRVVEMLGRKK